MPSQVSNPDADNIAGQIWIAFGRGARGMSVDASAVDEMISNYRKSYKDIIDAWEKNAPGIIVFTGHACYPEPQGPRRLAAERDSGCGKMQKPRIKILTTGGTIDKVYFDAKSTYEVGEPQIGEVLERSDVVFDYEIETLCHKDSLEMTDEDRQLILQNCRKSPEDRIVITHGTDTMVETARVLAGVALPKTIVLVGAMIPFAFGSSDGLFNLGSALSFVQVLPYGVYIAMNGRYFEWDRVRKNREIGVFERIDAETR